MPSPSSPGDPRNVARGSGGGAAGPGGGRRADDALDSRAGAVFAALADPTRRHLVRRLAAQPESTATGLAAELPISRQAVAKHLALLGEAGLVKPQKHGRETCFALQPQPLAEATAWIASVGAEWDERLERLEGFFRA